MDPPLRFLLDEHLRGPLQSAIERHNLLGGLPIDVIAVGDVADLPLGSHDATILAWAEREGRMVVTLDRRTMNKHLANHLAAGHHSPGVLILDPTCSIPTVIDLLELIAYAGKADDYRDHIDFVP